MSQKFNICFDIDDVLAKFVDEFVHRMNVDAEINQTGKYWEHPIVDYFFMKDHQDLFEAEILNGLFLELDPYVENVIYVNSLIDSGLFDVHFITARSKETHRQWSPELTAIIQKHTKTWVKHYFPTFDMNNLHFCGSKDEILRNLDIKFMTEDRADAALRFAQICKSFVITRPWNEKEPIGNAIRISSLCDLELFFNEHLIKSLKPVIIKEDRV